MPRKLRALLPNHETRRCDFMEIQHAACSWSVKHTEPFLPTPVGSQECSSGVPGAAQLPSTGPRTHQGTGAKFNLPQACCAGLRQPRVPKKTCHELFTHSHLPSILPSFPTPERPCDNGAPCDLGQAQHFPTEQSSKSHKPFGIQGFSLWREGAGGGPGCQRGGCRREAPVHTLCCPLFPQIPLAPSDIEAENHGMIWVVKDF